MGSFLGAAQIVYVHLKCIFKGWHGTFSTFKESKDLVPDFSGARLGQCCSLHAEHFGSCHFAQRVVQWYFCLDEESLIKSLFEN